MGIWIARIRGRVGSQFLIVRKTVAIGIRALQFLVIAVIIISIVPAEDVNLLACRTDVAHDTAVSIPPLIGEIVHIHRISPDDSGQKGEENSTQERII